LAIAENFNQPFISSKTCQMEWPPKSGKMQSFPEVNKAEWFDIPQAEKKIHPAQLPFIKQVSGIIHSL